MVSNPRKNKTEIGEPPSSPNPSVGSYESADILQRLDQLEREAKHLERRVDFVSNSNWFIVVVLFVGFIVLVVSVGVAVIGYNRENTVIMREFIQATTVEKK